MKMVKFSLIGALVVGAGLNGLTIAHGAINDIKSPESKITNEELPYLMRKEGIRKHVELENREDLSPIMKEAQSIAQKQHPSCVTEVLSEVRIQRDEAQLIAGYEVYADCEDAATPALGLYYDVNHKFLEVLDLAN